MKCLENRHNKIKFFGASNDACQIILNTLSFM